MKSLWFTAMTGGIIGIVKIRIRQDLYRCG